MYVTNPTYVPQYEYIITVDYSYNRRFIPNYGYYSHPRYRTHVYRRGYKTLGRGVIMAISDFKEMVENARKLKGYSQRELAKMIGMSQSTYNDTINGKIKKPDIDILKRIAEELDLSLDLMLKESGYGVSFSIYHFTTEKNYCK